MCYATSFPFPIIQKDRNSEAPACNGLFEHVLYHSPKSETLKHYHAMDYLNMCYTTSFPFPKVQKNRNSEAPACNGLFEHVLHKQKLACNRLFGTCATRLASPTSFPFPKVQKNRNSEAPACNGLFEHVLHHHLPIPQAVQRKL